MKKLKIITMLFSLLFVSAIWAKADQFVTQQPEKPKAGDNVVITYNPAAATANLKESKNIMLYVLCMDNEFNYILKELDMVKTNNTWSASFIIDKEVFFTYYFDDGATTEFNNDEAWTSMVYNAKAQPLPGANYFMAMLCNQGGILDFRLNKSKEKSKEYINKEIAANPSFVRAYASKWNTMMREKPGDETKAIVKKELNKVYSLNKNNEKEVYSLLQWFDKTDQKAKGDEIKSAFIKKNAKGYTAQTSSIEAVYNEDDAKKRIESANKVLTDFPGLEKMDKEALNSMILSAYVELNDYENAEKVMNEAGIKSSDSYNNMAWPLIEKGEQLDKATKWANEGMKLAQNPDPASKPSYYSTKTWKAQNERALGMISDTYAFGLYQLGYTIAAENHYEKSYSVLKGSDEDVNARYVTCLVNNGNYGKAVEVSEECLLKEKTNENLVKNYKIAWIKLGRSESEFDSKMGGLNVKAKEEAMSKLKKEMVNKPAIDFTLKSLDGKTVKLSDLKGKIVVIDFWATWCGPCKASFPALQKITDKYKDNPNIVILTLDTWEQVAGDERVAKVKEFIESNKYTFTVLFDDDFVTKYEVSGIPTKFIVDRYGKIQFKTVGFGGEAKMLSEMEAQFEILSNDDYLKELK